MWALYLNVYWSVNWLGEYFFPPVMSHGQSTVLSPVNWAKNAPMFSSVPVNWAPERVHFDSLWGHSSSNVNTLWATAYQIIQLRFSDFNHVMVITWLWWSLLKENNNLQQILCLFGVFLFLINYSDSCHFIFATFKVYFINEKGGNQTKHENKVGMHFLVFNLSPSVCI